MQQIIQQLRQHSSRLVKEQILETAIKADLTGEFVKGITYALNPYVTFGIKEDYATSSWGDGLDPNEFFNILDRFASRSITGNQAREILATLRYKSQREQWEDWYKLILNKDLNCGVGITTVNKILKKLKLDEIPVFKCQLANEIKDLQEIEFNNHGKEFNDLIVENKIDGARVLTFLDKENRTVTFYTRNGKELDFPELQAELFSTLTELRESVVLDGEMSSTDFQSLMTQFKRKSNAKKGDCIYEVFDVVPLFEFKNMTCSKPLWDRKNILYLLFEGEFKKLKLIKRVLNRKCETIDEIEEAFRLAIEQGFEGIMIKDPLSQYNYARTNAWLKHKPAYDSTFRVVQILPGTGKYENMLGSLVCEGKVNGKKISVQVGSGFSDEQRKEYNTQEMVGKLVDVMYDCVTKDGSLRFPRFLKVREDL